MAMFAPYDDSSFFNFDSDQTFWTDQPFDGHLGGASAAAARPAPESGPLHGKRARGESGTGTADSAETVDICLISLDHETLPHLSKADLKAECKSRGHYVSGTKDELIKRLLNEEASNKKRAKGAMTGQPARP